MLKVSTRVVGRAWKPKRRRARTVGATATGGVLVKEKLTLLGSRSPGR